MFDWNFCIPRTGGGDPISYGKIEPKSRYSPRMQGVYAMYSTFGDQNLDFFDVMVLLIKRDETSGLYRSFFLGRTMAYLFWDK